MLAVLVNPLPHLRIAAFGKALKLLIVLSYGWQRRWIRDARFSFRIRPGLTIPLLFYNLFTKFTFLFTIQITRPEKYQSRFVESI
jgi:hypothetical protein